MYVLRGSIGITTEVGENERGSRVGYVWWTNATIRGLIEISLKLKAGISTCILSRSNCKA